MIKPQVLHIRNFLSIESVDLVLENQGLVLIEGINQDDPSAKSNGSGKSSMVDALSWCLFGETARGVTGDAVINIKAGKETMVRLHVEVDGMLYQITRGRKHSEFKNRVVLKQRVHGVNAWTDITSGTDRLTQERINTLLGCTPDIFNASIYMGQEAMPDLPGMTDKALKGILEQALSLDKLDDALEVCKQRAQTANHDQTTAWNKMTQADVREADLKDSTKTLNDQVKTYRAELDKLNVERSDLQVAHVMRAARFKDSIDKAAALVTTMPKASWNDALQEVTDKVRDHYVPQLDALQEKRTKARDMAVKASVAVNTLQTIRDRMKDGACPTCGYEGEPDPDHAEKLARAEKDYQSTLDGFNRLHEARGKLDQQIDDLREEYSKALDTAKTNTLTTFNDQIKAQSELEMLRAEQKSVESAHMNQIAMMDRMIATKDKQWRDAKDAYKKDLGALLDVARFRSEAEAKHIEATARLNVLEKVKHVLGRKGFRGEVLDQVTPYLNARTQHYLGQLTDDNITAVWNTVSTNTNGDYVESFHISVTHKSGVEKFAALSGGEKRKVRLACALALQDLVGTRAVKPIKLFVADEIDDAIDEAGLELLMGLLEQKAKEVGTVFVISHNDIGDWVRNKITVIKKDGKTTFKKP